MWKIVSGFFEWVFSPILNVLNFPVVPAELVDIFTAAFEYMEAGMGLINWFCPLAMIQPALVVFLAVFAVSHSYELIMWVLRKIPFIGVK